MKTRIQNISPNWFSFQYAKGKPTRSWHFVGGSEAPAVWPTAAERDRARRCFTRRRSLEAAVRDLRNLELL